MPKSKRSKGIVRSKSNIEAELLDESLEFEIQNEDEGLEGEAEAETKMEMEIEQDTETEKPKIKIEESILKVYTYYREYNYSRPWRAPIPKSCTGSGFVVEGNYIFTNAHVISNQCLVEVRPAYDSSRFDAEVVFVDHNCDLALLSVKNPEFWQKIKPLKFGKEPEPSEKVRCYGYPRGGEELSITEGIVSRVEMQDYVHRNVNLIIAQVDAAINSGNSGGPAIINGKVVGVVHQSLSSAQSVGYIIPVSIVSYFLKESKRTPAYSFPELPIKTQKMENESLRKDHGLKKGQTGVLVTSVDGLSSAEDVILREDVLLEINDKTISNDGTIKSDTGKRIHFDYIIKSAHVGEKVSFKLLRKNKIHNLKITLTDTLRATRVIPLMEFDVQPTYYIACGFVFQPLTTNYLKDCWGEPESAPSKYVELYKNGKKTKEGEEVIIINGVLVGKINQGYHSIHDQIVTQVNDHRIWNMADLIKAFETNLKKDHHILTDSKLKIVIKNITSEEHQAHLALYDIEHDRSRNLKIDSPIHLRSREVHKPLIFSKKRKREDEEKNVIDLNQERKKKRFKKD